ncbi:MAG: hypothetical protein IJB97_10285 [Clostridia bacterium]|nr:hypothetical protein [Clostridia bacterium]
MANLRSLLFMTAISPYLTYIIIGLFAVAALIALLVGASKGFTGIGWGGITWGIACAGYFALDLFFRKKNPIIKLPFIAKLDDKTVQLASVITIAIACVLAALLIFSILALIFRRDTEDVKEYHYYSKSPYPYQPEDRKYENLYGQSFDEDYEDDDNPIKDARKENAIGWFNRLTGALVAVINTVVILAVILGAALVAINVTPLATGKLKELYDNKIIALAFPYAKKYILDFVMLGIIALFVRRGYSVGIVSGMRSLLVPIAKLGAVVGGIYLPFSPIAKEGRALAFIGKGGQYFANLLGKYIPAEFAKVLPILGQLIIGIILVVVFFLIVILVAWLLDRLVETRESGGFMRFVDGVVSVVAYVVIGAAVCGLFAAGLYMIEYLGFFGTSKFFAVDSSMMGNAWATLETYLKPLLDKFLG